MIISLKNNMKYLVCNLKANKIYDEIIEYEKELKKISINNEIELIVCPSTLFLYMFKSDNYKLGTQDISMYNIGPHTGENTAEQLSSLGVKYALIGHSERRKLFKEEENIIIEKIKKAYHSHIKPIYFVGETEEEKKKELAETILEKQIINILNEVPDYKREKMIIVYEPIWAIGSGILPKNEEIIERIEWIKIIIKKNYNLNLPVLYGGSIDQNNISELCYIENLDGFVIGESSKNIEELTKIYNTIKNK